MGPEGIVPCLLIFGVFPRMLAPFNKPFRQSLFRFKILQTTREEYATIVARLRIQLGIRKQPPPACDYVYNQGDSCYVYREKVKHWTGPHIMAQIDGKEILVHLGEYWTSFIQHFADRTSTCRQPCPRHQIRLCRKGKLHNSLDGSSTSS
jgi:hypothetical protein